MEPRQPDPLLQRVNELESEVHALKRRVAALEGLAAPNVAPPAVAPPLVPPPSPPKPVSQAAPVPPPIPPPPRATSPGGEPPAATPPVRPPAVPIAASAPPAPGTAPWPTTSAPAAPPIPERPSALHDLLDALHLLPPAGTKAGEAGIGAWWATRIGALILVIGIVFFGVYVSLSTPPWVRLLELAIIAGGITVGGFWLERRVERLGSVVMGAGLALGFFTAFAAYAVPAVKVIESVGVAALVQAAAVSGIALVALWRRSATVGTMAVLLGFVSAFFSFAEGFDDFAVVSGLALSAVAVFFRHRQGWGAPLLATAALVHVLNALVAMEVWSTEVGRRSALFAFGVVGAAWLVHLLSLLLEGGDARGRVATVQRWIQAVNTSLAVMAGFAAALQVLPDERLSYYFFGAGLVLVGAAAWAWRVIPGDGMFGMFAVKAASLIALGVIVEWDARTRWIALVVQAAVIMAAAVRTRRVSLAMAAFVAWLVSLLFFGDDVGGLRGQLVSGNGVAVLLYLLGGAALLSWLGGWLRARSPDAPGVGYAWLFGLLGAVPVLLALAVAWNEPWTVVACVGVAGMLGVMARLFRSKVPVAAAVLAMAAAHVLVQVYHEGPWGLAWLWAGAGSVAASSLVLLGWLKRTIDGADAGRRGAELVAATLAIAAISGAWMQSTGSYAALAGSIVLAVAAVAAGWAGKRASWTLAGLLAVPVIWGLHAWHRPWFDGGQGGEGWLWLAAGGVPAALGGAAWAAARDRAAVLVRVLAAAIGVLLAWTATRENLGAPGLAWGLLGWAVLYAGVGVLSRCGVSPVAASALLAGGSVHFLLHPAWADTDLGWALLVPVFLILIGFAAVPLLQARTGLAWRRDLERPWRVLHALAAVSGIMILATIGPAVWHDYGSVVWALGGVVLFVLGLMLRARSHRVVGLIALGLCIPRVFLYDIQSTKYRIAAFVVLGVLLLIVGFSYQRFRHLIGDSEETGARDRSDGAS